MPDRHARDGPTKGPARAPATVHSGEHNLHIASSASARRLAATRITRHDHSAIMTAAQPSYPPAEAAEVYTGCSGLCAVVANAKMSMALTEPPLSPRQPCDGAAAAESTARHARSTPAAAAMPRGACSTQMSACVHTMGRRVGAARPAPVDGRTATRPGPRPSFRRRDRSGRRKHARDGRVELAPEDCGVGFSVPPGRGQEALGSRSVQDQHVPGLRGTELSNSVLTG